MGEDKKNVWSKVEHRVGEAMSIGDVQSDLGEVVLLQLQVQGGVKGGAPYPLRGPCTPGGAAARMMTPEWNVHFKENVLAAHAELSEALEWTHWKSWKRYDGVEPTPEQVQNCKLELVDTLCFLLNAWNLLGGTGEELAVMHRVKCEENLARQRGGY